MNSAAVLLWSRSHGTREFALKRARNDTDVNGDTETSLTCIRLGERITVIGTQIEDNEPEGKESNRNNCAHATGAVVVDSVGG